VVELSLIAVFTTSIINKGIRGFFYMDRKEKEAKKEMEKQQKLDDIFTGKTQIKPDEIHKYGLIFLERNNFTVGQTVDIGYDIFFDKKIRKVPRFFALDVQNKRFYEDPGPNDSQKYFYQILEIDKITNPSIAILDREIERKIRNQSVIVKQRGIALEIPILDPNMPDQCIICKPYGDFNNNIPVFEFRAKQILAMLENAIELAKIKDQTNSADKSSGEPAAFCKNCGAPVSKEEKSNTCEFCGSPLQ
jgi:hypothetical protein